jgi:mono/diheme cytochrome c family protein
MAGLASGVVGVLGGLGAILSGLFLSKGRLLGTGFERLHHLFVWPAFGLFAVLVVWRLRHRAKIPARGFGLYLIGMGAAAGLMMAAGYFGGEMVLGVDPGGETKPPATADSTALAAHGHDLFLTSCAHCHGKNGDGDGPDEGEDLHGLGKSDARIASVVKNGIKGKMPKFGSKLSEADVQALIAYVQSLD